VAALDGILVCEVHLEDIIVVQFCYLITQVFVSEAIKAGSDTMNRELHQNVVTKHLSTSG
jgi:hypothetical protein